MIKIKFENRKGTIEDERNCFTLPQIDHHIEWLDKMDASDDYKQAAFNRRDWILTQEFYKDIGD